jgi:hypothetical protein
VRLQIHDLYSRHTQTLDGSPESIEGQLSIMFPEQAQHVDPDEGLQALIDCLNEEFQGREFEVVPVDLEKASPPPDFPKLGVHNKKDTPYVTTGRDLDMKSRLMFNATYHGAPLPKSAWQGLGEGGKQLHEERQREMDARRDQSHRGASIMTSPEAWRSGQQAGRPGARISYAKAGTLAGEPKPLRDIKPWGSSAGTSTGTKHHEDLHQMFAEVRLRYGDQARLNLGWNLWAAIPRQYRQHVEDYQNHAAPGYRGKPLEKEELLARMLNYVNSPVDRDRYHGVWGKDHSPEERRAISTAIKRAYKSFLAAAEIAHEGWLNPWGDRNKPYGGPRMTPEDRRTPRSSYDVVKSERLEKMAIADIRPGRALKPFGERQRTNYTHLLPQGHRLQGYKLHVEHHPGLERRYAAEDSNLGHDVPVTYVRAVLTHKTADSPRMRPGEAGHVTATLDPATGSLKIGASEVVDEHQGKKGVPLYEALLAHAKHKLGAQKVSGSTHSTMAMRVHSKLAAKHGLAYEAKPNYGTDVDTAHWETQREWKWAPTGPNDERYQPYEYAIKSEMKKSKSIPTFPSLGAGDDRRETDYVQPGRQKDIKNAAIVNSAVRNSPNRERVNASPGRKWLLHDARVNIASKTKDGGAATTFPDAQHSLVNADDPIAGPGVVAHENLHMLFGRIEQMHGPQARANLARNLMWSIPERDRMAVEDVANYYQPNAEKKDEERLAHMISYLNTPSERALFHAAKYHSPRVQHDHEQALKRAHRHILRTAPTAPPEWLTDGGVTHRAVKADLAARIDAMTQEISTPEGMEAMKTRERARGAATYYAAKAKQAAFDAHGPDINAWPPEVRHQIFKKSESNLLGDETSVVQDMHGFQPHLHSAFAAARFLVGAEPVPLDAMRRALYQHDDDLEAAALTAYGLEVSEPNRQALRAVQKYDSLDKFEQAPISRAAPVVPEAQESANKVQTAINEGQIEHVKLGGKHSKGSLLARTSDEILLLKPGSGGQSPAAGAQQDQVSQSRREAAFAAVAASWGLSEDVPAADLLSIDGHEYAAIHMLPFTWKNALKVEQKDQARVHRALERYRQNGLVHQWAILDFVCGNPDRHGQNVMIGPDDEVALIDHGSAFAGSAFDPAHDQNSFVPYYLRFGIKGFNSLTTDEKLARLPTVTAEIRDHISQWLLRLDAARFQQILEHYGVDPGPSLARLAQVRMQRGDIDAQINRMWVTV